MFLLLEKESFRPHLSDCYPQSLETLGVVCHKLILLLLLFGGVDH